MENGNRKDLLNNSQMFERVFRYSTMDYFIHAKVKTMDSLASRSQVETTVAGTQLQLPLLSRCAIVRSQKASRITWHSHSFYEILIVLEGSTEYEFENGHVELLTGGRFLTISPGIRHRGRHDVRRPANLFGMLIGPSGNAAAKNSPFTRADLAWIVEHIRQGNARTHRMNSEIRGYINSLTKPLREVQSASTATLISMRLAICGILVEVAKQIACSTSAEPQQVVQDAVEYMRSNLRSEASIEAVAKFADCSRSKLFALFKESIGMTPNDYWLRIRIEHAQAMLRSTTMPVTQIGLECGFSTSQYFSTVFKKYAGASPSEYRAMSIATS